VLAPAMGFREHPATCERAERASHGALRFQVGAESSCEGTTNSSAHGRETHLVMEQMDSVRVKYRVGDTSQ
jgi:hypothetical protein